MITKVRRTTARAVTIKRPDPIPLTQVGLDKAKADYAELQVKREEVLIRLQAAREQGDLSENGAYTSAKFELGTIDRELRRLGHLLKYGVVTDNSGSSKVSFGSTVTIDNDKTEMTFMLVSQYESDPVAKKLSEQSPFGKAVLGRSVGDTVVVVAPAGETKWKIISIK
jgi:transcription elongation factor GreA